MTAHRVFYILATVAAVVGLAYVALADPPELDVALGIGFVTLGLFTTANWIDTR